MRVLGQMRSSSGTDPLPDFHVHHRSDKLGRNLVGKVGGTRHLWVIHIQPATDLEQQIVAVSFSL